MTYYTRNLMENVIDTPAKSSDELIVVSGYASAGFLDEVVNRCPNHKIKLILGMTPHGISRHNFDGFLSMCREKENVDVLFQVVEPPTHMKLYQWYDQGKPKLSFQGSANFSYSGFKYQKEIITKCENDFDMLIKEIISSCLSCLNSQITDIIKIFEDEDYKKIDNVKEILGEYGSSEFSDIKNNKDKTPSKSKNYIRPSPLKRISINLILKNDKLWNARGLNVWNREGYTENDSFLDLEKYKRGIDEFLPRNSVVELLTNDGLKLLVERRGEYGKELVILNEETNFYDYFSRRLTLDTNKPISYADLKAYGRTDVEITKIGNNRFKLDF